MRKIPLPITGHCYCGAISIECTGAPQTVAHCHCDDCRRWTGGAVSTFVAFDETDVVFSGGEIGVITPVDGVTRKFCKKCGSPLSGAYSYLPGQLYVPIGVLDQADLLVPEVHSHVGERLSWLHIKDDAEEFDASSRSRLSEARSGCDA